jgi:hypothetical protein
MVTPYNHVEIHHCIGETYGLHLQGKRAKPNSKYVLPDLLGFAIVP